MAAGNDNPLSKVVDSLPTIPAAAKPGLLRGLSYLLGGLSNYLGAWLRRPVQAVEDRTDARTVITQAVALAAAEKLASDPDIVAAAMAQWGPADLNRQLNKMKIAKETIKEISDQPNTSGDSKDDVPPPSDDFLNSFERFCADSSEEDMQKLWARLLAGEILRPGSFSRHTMRCLYELDSETAKLFERIAVKTVGYVLLAGDSEKIETFEINQLQMAGLITGAGGIYNYTFQFNEKGISILRGIKHLLIAKQPDGGKDFTVTSYPLSQAGIELLSLLPEYDEKIALKAVADRIPTNVACEISLASFAMESGKLKIGTTESVRAR